MTADPATVGSTVGPFDDLETFVDGNGLRRFPALDGVRGLAVLAVAGFHGEWAVLRGGFLGVSLFFTLSGFLITSLLIAEVDRSGSVSLRRFWSRRFRRLLPAAWMTILGVAAGAVVLGVVSPGLPADSWAALAQVANWRFLARGQRYADLFATSSPLIHFWSLAIEEQFYLVVPLVVWGVARRTRSGSTRKSLALVVGTAALVSFVLPFAFHMSVNRVYLGTDTRAGELLVGALLAIWMSSPSRRTRLAQHRQWRNAAVIAGLVGAVATACLWAAMTQTSAVLRSGGFAVVACASVGLVVSALVPLGPIHRLLLVAPLRWIGRISYGIYLFHWPLLAWITTGHTGLPHLANFAIAMTLAIGLAALSSRFVEGPIRRGAISGNARLRPLVAIAVVILLVTPIGLRTKVDRGQQLVSSLDADVQRFGSSPTPSSTTPPTGSQQGTAPERPKVAMFGDSVLLTLALSMDFWNPHDLHFIGDGGVVRLGCGVVRGGSYMRSAPEPVKAECDDWPTSWPGEVRRRGADVAVVMSCQWELVGRRLSGQSGIVTIGEPAYDELIRSEFLAATDSLLGAGARFVEWVTCPHLSRSVGTGDLDPGLRASRDPARVDRQNALIREAAAARPNTVAVLDLASWVDQRTDDKRLRPDGSHYEHAKDTGVAEAFGSRLVDAWNAWRTTR